MRSRVGAYLERGHASASELGPPIDDVRETLLAIADAIERASESDLGTSSVVAIRRHSVGE